jgi:hypothetical protein
MTGSILSPRPPKDEPPHGWGVLLALLKDWGITGRFVVLIGVPIAAVVVIVALVVAIIALVVIYLGPIGVGALVVSGSGGYGIKRLIDRRR